MFELMYYTRTSVAKIIYKLLLEFTYTDIFLIQKSNPADTYSLIMYDVQ